MFVHVHPNQMFLVMTQLANDPARETQTTVEQQAIRRVATALKNIEVHVPFETMAAWAARRTGRKSAMRESNILQPTNRLDLLAANLGNAYHSLKNALGSDHWKETLEYVRLGLGDDIDDIPTNADAAGGQLAASIRYKSSGQVPAIALSDGTLAYLAFVALLRLPSTRTLLAFDEPELHLHPGLLVRVLSMCESVAQSCPVVLATHSDRLLDALQEPAKSVVLCDLDENRASRLIHPDEEMLAKWLTKYRGLGDIRSTGLLGAVIPRPEASQ
jgi:predicted ATPase